MIGRFHTVHPVELPDRLGEIRLPPHELAGSDAGHPPSVKVHEGDARPLHPRALTHSNNLIGQERKRESARPLPAPRGRSDLMNDRRDLSLVRLSGDCRRAARYGDWAVSGEPRGRS